MIRNDEDVFSGLGPPIQPLDLKNRVLSAARPAVAVAPQPDIWWILWTSRTFRLVWVTAVFGLLAVHLGLPFSRAPKVVEYSMPVIMAAADEDAELAEITRLPRITRDLPSLVGRATTEKPPEEAQS